ncbi:MAG: 50S ribosomal protein L22 [Candidatus Buchananbacteria bacterium]|nr:50S ribosomal protein L22 [Candidatus Buchananbacteria bacterium]
MQAKAKLSFLRMSPKKVRLVADLIRGLKVEEAASQLNFSNKAAQKPILKLLNSALSNAENNFELKKDNLYIKEIRVDQAGMLKRWQPRAHGRATPIRKKMSHVKIVLEEIEPTQPKKTKKTKPKEEKPIRMSSKEEIKETLPAEQVKAEDKEQIKAKQNEQEKGKEIIDQRMEGKHRHKQHMDKTSMKQSKGFINKIFKRKSG